jgi:hypothetical protein
MSRAPLSPYARYLYYPESSYKDTVADLAARAEDRLETGHCPASGPNAPGRSRDQTDALSTVS